MFPDLKFNGRFIEEKQKWKACNIKLRNKLCCCLSVSTNLSAARFLHCVIFALHTCPQKMDLQVVLQHSNLSLMSILHLHSALCSKLGYPSCSSRDYCLWQRAWYIFCSFCSCRSWLSLLIILLCGIFFCSLVFWVI